MVLSGPNCSSPGSGVRLFLVERLVNRDGATFAGLERPFCLLKPIQSQRDSVHSGGNLHASWCELSVETPSKMISAPFGTEFICAQAMRPADFAFSGTFSCVWILS